MSVSANETETELPPDRVAALSDPQLIDVREDYEHEAGHIPGSRHIDVTELTAASESLDRDRPVVFYCRSGDRSTMPTEAFRASGWEAYTLEGGLAAWVESGQPLEPEDGEVAHRRPGPQT
jgi:rhodanese-related sulfurtransferase